VAKTIGRDKGSTTRAPLSAETEAASTADAPNDEDVRDEDVRDEDRDENTADEPADEDADTGDERDLVVAPPRALNRVPSAAVARAPRVPAPLLANPFTRYIAESYLELRKVTAPTPQEAWNMTLIVILMAGVVAAILGVADIALVRALTWIVSLGTSGGASPTTH
jgi:preprotein translocase SecE subunit